MRKLLVLTVTALLTACGGGGSSFGGPQAPVDTACSNNGQKQFVLDAMRDWYFWNDLLPANVDINNFSTPEALLQSLTSVQPLDNFSSINTAAADSQFFGEGEFEGFGFTSRFVAADDLRLVRVFTSSPANAAGLARGQQILMLNGRTIAEIQAAEGVGAVIAMTPLEFTMRETNGNEFTVTVAQGLVTIDPVPQSRIIDVGAGVSVGYLELAQFISTADPRLDAVFGQFRAAGVNDVIIDMRYNGGGLVSTAELLGDYLGGSVAQSLLFSETLFNDDRAPANNRSEIFELRGNSISLSRLVIIASQGTASASELVTNSMEPHAAEVIIVGDRTFGKPVGQVGLTFCDQILRATAFQTVNANGFGDYFNGLPADCIAADDLNVAVGADTDPNVQVALAYLASGACPTASVPGALAKPADGRSVPQLDMRGPAHREFAGAW